MPMTCAPRAAVMASPMGPVIPMEPVILIPAVTRSPLPPGQSGPRRGAPTSHAHMMHGMGRQISPGEAESGAPSAPDQCEASSSSPVHGSACAFDRTPRSRRTTSAICARSTNGADNAAAIPVCTSIDSDAGSSPHEQATRRSIPWPVVLPDRKGVNRTGCGRQSSHWRPVRGWSAGVYAVYTPPS